jgi:hypothetical protein
MRMTNPEFVTPKAVLPTLPEPIKAAVRALAGSIAGPA